jgi:hypothetical protein
VGQRRQRHTCFFFDAASKLSGMIRLESAPGTCRRVEETEMKQYLLTVCYPAGATQPPPETLQKIMRDVGSVQKEMQAAGVWVFSGGLHAANTATVLRQRNGEIVITDGPFIESKEQIGGITILAVPDLDAALGWGRKLALAIGVPIEVRPFMEGHC